MDADHPFLPEDVENHLDDLLAAWAQAHRITPTQAEAVRHRVLETPKGVERRLRRRVSAQAMGAQTPVTSPAPGSVLFVLDAVSAGLASWPTASPGAQRRYRPYLRLT